jgi:hypothetical protein
MWEQMETRNRAASHDDERHRLKILILHQNTDLARVRRTSFNHAFCLLKYASWNEYELHSFGELISPRLRRKRFDAILLDTTFLCWRWALPYADHLDRLLRDYDFIADSTAVKIALPQDEYDEAERLDYWLAAWRVDLIYSACYAHHHVFYPKASRHAEVAEGLTGYIDDADVAMTRRVARPFPDREIDVGYRAKDLPPHFGRFGRLKAAIGEKFLGAAQGRGWHLDIGLGDAPENVLVGDDWLKFLGNCRFTLGCESGSSLLDPRGAIRAACSAYLRNHPDADFDEVEAACFPGQDMKRVYSAISPRVFEAALAGACQILVPGHYAGVLSPDEHYVPLAADFSNIEAVLDELKNWPRAQQRVAACREALLGDERLTYRGFVADLLRRIEIRLDQRTRTEFVAVSETPAERAHELAALAVRTAVDRANDLKEILAFCEAPVKARAGSMLRRAPPIVRRLMPRPVRSLIRRWVS